MKGKRNFSQGGSRAFWCHFLVTLVGPTGLFFLTGCVSPQLEEDRRTVSRLGLQESSVETKVERGEALMIEDILALHEAGAETGFIQRAVERGGGVYSLQTEDLERLREAGVADSLINYLLRTPFSGAEGARRPPHFYPYPYYRSGFHPGSHLFYFHRFGHYRPHSFYHRRHHYW